MLGSGKSRIVAVQGEVTGGSLKDAWGLGRSRVLLLAGPRAGKTALLCALYGLETQHLMASEEMMHYVIEVEGRLFHFCDLPGAKLHKYLTFKRKCQVAIMVIHVDDLVVFSKESVTVLAVLRGWLLEGDLDTLVIFFNCFEEVIDPRGNRFIVEILFDPLIGVVGDLNSKIHIVCGKANDPDDQGVVALRKILTGQEPDGVLKINDFSGLKEKKHPLIEESSTIVDSLKAQNSDLTRKKAELEKEVEMLENVNMDLMKRLEEKDQQLQALQTDMHDKVEKVSSLEAKIKRLEQQQPRRDAVGGVVRVSLAKGTNDKFLEWRVRMNDMSGCTLSTVMESAKDRDHELLFDGKYVGKFALISERLRETKMDRVVHHEELIHLEGPDDDVMVELFFKQDFTQWVRMRDWHIYHMLKCCVGDLDAKVVLEKRPEMKAWWWTEETGSLRSLAKEAFKSIISDIEVLEKLKYGPNY